MVMSISLCQQENRIELEEHWHSCHNLRKASQVLPSEVYKQRDGHVNLFCGKESE